MVIITLFLILIVAIIISVFYSYIRDDQKGGAKLVKMTLPDNTQIIGGNIDEVRIETSGWKDFMVIKGWAFKRNVKENSREFYLVFKSENRTLVYDLENGNLVRPDVTQYFKMTGGVDNHGFEGRIPMKDFTDSSYQVGFVIKDKTGQYFSMSSKEIAFSDGSVKFNNSNFVEKRVSIPIKAESAKIKYNFDNINISGNKLDVNGWAFLEGTNTDSLKTYIVLRSTKTIAVFSVDVQPRNDITSYFNKTQLNLDLSGFSSRISTKKMEKDRYQVGLYIEKGNQAGIAYSDKYFDLGE